MRCYEYYLLVGLQHSTVLGYPGQGLSVVTPGA